MIGLFSPHCAPVIAVLGAHQDIVRAGLRRTAQACLIENPDFRLGQISSMQCGLRAVPAHAESVLFTLVDHPAVQSETIAALLAEPPAPLRVPRYSGRHGHPIVFARALIPEFLAVPAGSSAKEVVTRHTTAAAYVDVQDPGILADIDDLDAYHRLTAESRA